MNAENKPLSMPKLEKLIQFQGDGSGRALLYELEARERSRRVQIITRTRGAKRSHARATLAAIRKHAPDLMPSDQQTSVSALLSEARRYLKSVDDQIEKSVAEFFADRVEPELVRLHQEDVNIAETVRDLAAKLEAVALTVNRSNALERKSEPIG